ncbi:MAG: 3-isopropylmalate dehydrogenase [Thermomicrobiales bacterium]
MRAKIIRLAGDGVGPEVMVEATRALDVVAARWGHEFELEDLLIGGAALDAWGVPMRDEDVETCSKADAILMASVGGPKWDGVEQMLRPERGLLKLRKSLRLYANLRPVTVLPALYDASPLKTHLLEGVDVMVVRELTGGLYFGRPSRQWREFRGMAAVDTLIYREHEIRRIVRLAFESARGRRKLVTSVDKSNVLQSSRLWHAIVDDVAKEFPDVTYQHALVDSMAMHLVTKPAAFDVIVTENMFGDILTDEASVLAGSIGLLPSASLGPVGRGRTRPLGLYEPIHGSAPDIAGQGKANPCGTILSVAMMLRLSLGLDAEAAGIEQAVRNVIEAGVRTGDLSPSGKPATTTEMGKAIAAEIARV